MTARAGGFVGRLATLSRHTPDNAACMYYAGVDPFTKKPVQTAKSRTDRKLQRALMQFFKPENHLSVRESAHAETAPTRI